MNTTAPDTVSGDDILAKMNAHEALSMFPVILFYAVVLIVGLFGNLLVLIVYTFRYKRSQARVFILFLAANDFLMCLFGLPYQLVDMTHPYTYTNSVLCKVSSFIMVSLFHTSVFGLVVIAVDRYTKICHPLGKFHTQYFGKRRACVIAVVFGLLLSWPMLFLYGPSEMETGVHNVTGYACFYETTDPESNVVLIYSMTTVCFCVGSTICLIVLYSLVFYQIYSRYQKGASLRSLQQHAEDSTYYINEDKDSDNSVQNDKMPGHNHNNRIEEHDDMLSGRNHRNDVGEQDTIFTVKNKIESIPKEQCVKGIDSGKHCDIDSDTDDRDDCIRNLINESKHRHVDENVTDTRAPNITDKGNAYVILKPDAGSFDGEGSNSNNTNETNENDNEANVLQGSQSSSDNDSVHSRSRGDHPKHLHNDNNQTTGISSTDGATTNSKACNQEGAGSGGFKGNQIKIPSETNNDILESDEANLKESLRQFDKDTPVEMCKTRSQSTRHQSTRLSLPLNSLHSLASSKSSITSSLNTNQRVVTFGGENGLRIHRRINNTNQRCDNRPDQLPKGGHSKITKIMITITTLFILSYTPTLVIIIWSNLRPEIWDVISIHQTLVFEFCLRFYLINNICNPFIYGFWDRRFKREVVIALRKIRDKFTCCTR